MNAIQIFITGMLVVSTGLIPIYRKDLKQIKTMQIQQNQNKPKVQILGGNQPFKETKARRPNQ